MTTITIENYHTDADMRALADRILADAGLDRDDCTGIVIDGDQATIALLARNEDGKPYMVPSPDGEMRVARRSVKVAV